MYYSRSDRNLQLEYAAVNHSDIQLQFINLKGQTVYRSSLKGTGNDSVQLPTCAPSIYLIRLTDKEGWNQTRILLL